MYKINFLLYLNKAIIIALLLVLLWLSIAYPSFEVVVSMDTDQIDLLNTIHFQKGIIKTLTKIIFLIAITLIVTLIVNYYCISSKWHKNSSK